LPCFLSVEEVADYLRCAFDQRIGNSLICKSNQNQKSKIKIKKKRRKKIKKVSEWRFFKIIDFVAELSELITPVFKRNEECCHPICE